MKMRLYYVVEEEGFDDEVECTMQAGPFATWEQAYHACQDYQFVVEQVADVAKA